MILVMYTVHLVRDLHICKVIDFLWVNLTCLYSGIVFLSNKLAEHRIVTHLYNMHAKIITSEVQKNVSKVLGR